MKRQGAKGKARASKRKHVARVIEDALGGATAAAVAGALVGPVGPVAGAALGVAAGAVAKDILEHEEKPARAGRRRLARGKKKAE